MSKFHFTYRNCDPEAHLQQGDILRRTPELEAVFQSYHPYYLKEDYSHFLVLTQSCDLVLRNGECESPYIAVSPVRPLSVVLDREAERYKYSTLLKKAKALSTANKKHMEGFLRRILNNNHPEYFYCHQEPLIGLVDRACAFLRLSIAFRSNEHYAVAKSARLASLASSFEPKLGWLVGNLYSRVGTEDWTPVNATEEEFKTLIADILDQSIFWLADAQLRAVKLPSTEIDASDAETLRKRVKDGPKNKKKDDLIDAVMRELESGSFVEAGNVDKIRKRLHNAQDIAALFK